jgi:PGF-pre-PGF domain-containing protein
LLGEGAYLYILNSTGGANWTVNATGVTRNITVSKGTLSLSISGSDVTYPDSVAITTSESNGGDLDVNYTLYRNTSSVPVAGSTTNGTAPSGQTVQLTVGAYLYTFNATGGANWTANTTGVTKNVTVNSAPETTTTTIPVSGGGGRPPEIPYKKSQSWDKITPGKAEIMHVADPEIGVKTIEITVKNTVKTVTITVTKLAGKPASVVQEVTGKVYKYMEITPTNIPDENIDKVKIQFQVEKSWISSNKLNSATIALNRYKNNAWQKLTTKEVSADNDYIYYEAETPGFSTFAVTGEEAMATTVAATTVATTIATTVRTTIPIVREEVGGVPSWITGVLIVIICFVFLIWMFRKLGGRRHKKNTTQQNQF